MNRADLLREVQRHEARPEGGRQGQEWLGRPPYRLLTNPGAFIRLGPEAGYSHTIAVEANDPLINEFCLYLMVEPASFKLMGNPLDPKAWGVSLTTQPSFDSANFNYYRPSNANTPLPVPVVGMSLPLHGQRVGVQITREKGLTGEMELVGAIIPRLPGCARDTRNGNVSNASSFSQIAPAMSATVKFLTNISVGDQLIFRDPEEGIVFATVVSADMLLKPIALPKMAYRVEYFTTSLAAKSIMFDFETSF
jgi:hypothetical protein